MNALVKKEIRLLLPAWIAVLLLEMTVPWFTKDAEIAFATAPLFFGLGIVILAIDPFGREFSAGTFTSLLSQPVERRRIWRVKLTILSAATAVVFVAYLLSCLIAFGRHDAVHAAVSFDFFWNAMIASGVLALVALSGGLWATLLLRQIATAFWFALLTPIAILALIVFSPPEKFASSDTIMTALMYGVAAIYIGLGYWVARWLFYRAQDVAWTGGVVSFSRWRYFDAGTPLADPIRCRKPLGALVKKEFQLHSISLFGAGAVLVLHIAVLFLRTWYVPHHRFSMAEGLSDFFWMLWLVFPLAMGCMAVAEERKLGVSEAESCQPVSRRWRFLIKFVPVVVLGTLLGGVVPVLLETFASRQGAPSSFFRSASDVISENFWGIFFSQSALFQASIIAGAFGLSFLSFFASTVARNFLQALSMTIVAIVFCLISGGAMGYVVEHRILDYEIIGPPILLVVVAVLTILPSYLWLAYRNANDFRETGRLWRRNGLTVTATLLFVLGTSAGIHNRAWEIFKPAEPRHGPAKLSLSDPPRIKQSFWDNFLVQLPDGRFCLNCFVHEDWQPPIMSKWRMLLHRLLPSMPKPGPQQFVAGRDWASVSAGYVETFQPGARGFMRIAGYFDTVGVRSNGTLWVSAETNQNHWTGTNLVQYGDETDWRQVSRKGVQILLLKTDGTLWGWGTNQWRYAPRIPTIQHSVPERIGADSDWDEVTGEWPAYLRKRDGSIWTFEWKDNKEQLVHRAELDGIPLRNSSWTGVLMAYVGADGALWDRTFYQNKPSEFRRIGTETNWVSVAVSYSRMVALKNDGTLWQWDLPLDTPVEKIAATSPTLLSRYHDWVALTYTWEGAVSLAADGSLWLWPGMDRGPQGEIPIVKPPKRARYVGNVLAASPRSLDR